MNCPTVHCMTVVVRAGWPPPPPALCMTGPSVRSAAGEARPAAILATQIRTDFARREGPNSQQQRLLLLLLTFFWTQVNVSIILFFFF